jgi:putative membrane protein
MTIVMEELHRILPGEHEGPLPPREVTEGVYERIGGDVARTPEESLEQATVVAHYAFGGAAGALFPIIAPRRLPAALGAGVLYGMAVWTGSYLGLLPALGVRHHARHDPPGRTVLMIAAHVVWGATLALVLRSRPGLRAASRHPD